nr:MAG TPA_asm: hypothetical protein [Caudoviricetes sp.]
MVSESAGITVAGGDDRQFLDFDISKVQTLTLEQLARTEKENDYNGKPLMGIYHFQLIQQIQEMCAERGYKAEIWDLFAANNKDRRAPGVSRLPQKEEKYGERAIEAHILRRVYCNIRLYDLDKGEGDDAITTNLAISFHQKGLQVGIGRNVVICHNQTMLNREQYAATYKDGRTPGIALNEMIAKIGVWLDDLRNITADDDEKIEKMKRRVISAQEMFTIIGMLTSLRVASETKFKAIRNNNTIPLNQAQISRITEKMMLAYQDRGKVTAWDFYNAATDMYKPYMLDQPMILSQNLALVDFIETHVL